VHQFETLDISLQDEFEKFLQERGISENLAFFIPEYAQHKEQKVRKLQVIFFSTCADVLLCLGIRQLAGQSQGLHRSLKKTARISLTDFRPPP